MSWRRGAPLASSLASAGGQHLRTHTPPVLVLPAGTRVDSYKQSKYITEPWHLLMTHPRGSSLTHNRYSGRFRDELMDVPGLRDKLYALQRDGVIGVGGIYLGCQPSWASTWEMWHYQTQDEVREEKQKKYGVAQTAVPVDSTSEPYWGGKFNPAYGFEGYIVAEYKTKQPIELVNFDVQKSEVMVFFEDIVRNSDDLHKELKQAGLDIFKYLGSGDREPWQIMSQLTHLQYPELAGCSNQSFRADTSIEGGQHTQVVALHRPDGSSVSDALEVTGLRPIYVSPRDKRVHIDYLQVRNELDLERAVQEAKERIEGKEKAEVA